MFTIMRVVSTMFCDNVHSLPVVTHWGELDQCGPHGEDITLETLKLPENVAL